MHAAVQNVNYRFLDTSFVPVHNYSLKFDQHNIISLSLQMCSTTVLLASYQIYTCLAFKLVLCFSKHNVCMRCLYASHSFLPFITCAGSTHLMLIWQLSHDHDHIRHGRKIIFPQLFDLYHLSSINGDFWLILEFIPVFRINF